MEYLLQLHPQVDLEILFATHAHHKKGTGEVHMGPRGLARAQLPKPLLREEVHVARMQERFPAPRGARVPLIL